MSIDKRSWQDDGLLGVGLGIDVHSEEPDWRELLRSGLPFDFFEVYTRGDAAAGRELRDAAGSLPLLYHDDDLDPILEGDLRPEALAAAVSNMEVTGAPWCVSELATRRLGKRYLDFFQPLILSETAARVAADNLKIIDQQLPGRIVAENPPFQLPVGPLHILDAMALVCEWAQVDCVLDLGHLYSFQSCRGLSPLAGVDGFDLRHVVELHVAGAEIERKDGIDLYQDAHGAADILPEVLEMLADLAPRCPRLKAITIEVEDGCLDRCAQQLDQTRSAVAGLLKERDS